MAASSMRDKLRSTLQSLESFELESKFSFLKEEVENQQNGTNSQSTQALLQTYQSARDEYLKRRMLQSFLAQLETYGDGKFSPPEDDPTEEEQEALQERQRAILGDIQSSVKEIQDARNNLKSLYESFQTKRQHLLESAGPAVGNDPMEVDNEDGVDLSGLENVDDKEIKRQEDYLISLQQRSSALKDEIRSVQANAYDVEKNLKADESSLAQLKANNPHLSTLSMEQLERENVKLEKEVEKWEKAHDFYETMLNIHEELGGVQIISVQADSTKNEDLMVTVEILRKHRIQLGLRCVESDEVNMVKMRDPNNLKVVRAEFVTPTTVRSQVDQAVCLQIPDLSDLLASANDLSHGENMRFVLRETVSRIRVVEARVDELADLKANVSLTKIGAWAPTSSAGGGSPDQEVLCTLEQENLTIVLRLTPDCPLLPYSVSITQMVGLGGWDETVVSDIVQTVQGLPSAEQPFCRPLDVIRSIRAEILHRRETQGLVLPGTPKMPSRR